MRFQSYWGQNSTNFGNHRFCRTVRHIGSVVSSSLDTSLFSSNWQKDGKRGNMFLRTSLFVLALCLESHLVRATGCDQNLSWGEIITVPKDQKGNYINNLHCTFEAKFVTDIEPNVLQLSWYVFDISGKMPDCDTDYLEIYVR